MEALLDVTDLRVSFHTMDGDVQVLRDVSFSVAKGETVAIVGESGSGKSVTALALMRLLGEGRIDGGSIRFDSRELVSTSESAYRKIRGRQISMIFQDPLTALDPLFTIGYQLREALLLGGTAKREVAARMVQLMAEVGIPDPERRIRSYPHELSGGQRQRMLIAMAIACAPQLIVADEPTTALDATVEAQILDLIRRLQVATGTALIMITHDMSVVAQVAQRVIVMYAGIVVEEGAVRDVLADPIHPYTRALISAVPRISMAKDEPVPTIEGSVPSLHTQVSGCRFHPRCPLAMDICRLEEPPSFVVGADRRSRCWLNDPAGGHSRVQRLEAPEVRTA